jgi:AcrR family transcriptional regulator
MPEPVTTPASQRPSRTARHVRTPVNATAISETALKLFAERGYRATTMADIGVALGIRGPSLYKHVTSKQDLLFGIMLGTITSLIENQEAAKASGGDVTTRLRRVVEAHVRFHAAHREEAFVGNRELNNLEGSNHDVVLAMRDTYERGLRALIDEGVELGTFDVRSTRLASYSILDMGMGLAAWFRADGPLTTDEVAYALADFALRMVLRVEASG